MSVHEEMQALEAQFPCAGAACEQGGEKTELTVPLTVAACALVASQLTERTPAYARLSPRPCPWMYIDQHPDAMPSTVGGIK
jgi:hypothetical protein